MLIKMKSNWIVMLLKTLLIYFLVRVNQTDFLRMIYYKNYSKGTLPYTIYDYLFPYEISSLVIMFALLFFVFRSPECRIKYYDVIVSGLAGLFSIWGISFRLDDTWNLAMGSRFCLLALILYVVGSICLFVTAKGYICEILRITEDADITTNKGIKIFDKILESRLKTFVFITCIWMIWLLLRYPGGLQWDEFNQIEMVLNHNIYTQHWPIFTTFYYGGLVYLGTHLFGNENLGLFLAVFIQLLYCSFVAAYVLGVLKKCNTKKIFQIITMLILAQNPIIARFVSTASKDAAYAFTLLWVCGIITEFLICDDYDKKTYVKLAISSALLCLIRKNGNLTLMPVALMFLIIVIKGLADKNKEIKKYIFVILAIVVGIVVESGTSNAFAACGVPKGPFKESLSVPLQQTARLARDYPDVVTQEDRQILSRVIDLDYIATAYDPKTSDPVKDTYYGEDMSDFAAYLKIWTKYLVKAPSIYVQAFLHMNGDFVDINASFIELSKVDFESTNRYQPCAIEGKFRVFTDFYEGFPLVWPICNVGIQSWLAIYLILIAIDKKSSKMFILTLPAALTLIICLMGPTFINKGIRYLLPVMVINPFVFNMFLARNNMINEKKTDEVK